MENIFKKNNFLQIWIKTQCQTENQLITFFLNFHLPCSSQKFRLFMKISLLFLFYFFENKFFILPSSFSSCIYNIVIAINTPTTMNNRFDALNAHKNRFWLLSHFLWTKNNISFTFSLYSSKKIQDFDSKMFKVYRTIQAHAS